MDITSSSSRLLSNRHFIKICPPDTAHALQAASGSAYVDELVELALNPIYTSTIFAIHDDISVELCGRWLSSLDYESRSLEVISAISQVLPFSSHLLTFAKSVLEKNPSIFTNLHHLDNILSTSDSDREGLRLMLLCLIRLVRFNNETFSPLISPAHLQFLLRDCDHCIRYLAAVLFCDVFLLSEHQLEDILDKCIDQEKVECSLEGKLLNLRFLDLWEKQRIFAARETQSETEHQEPTEGLSKKILSSNDYAPTTTNCGGILCANNGNTHLDSAAFISTGTTSNNLRDLAKAVKRSSTVLISGSPGSGKSMTVDHLSRLLGKHDDMVTLHLNDQSEFQTLIGLYTNDESSGTFQYRPGCLTKAVQDGQWVVIEDLDRAPRDIVASLLSLVERGELYIASQGSTIRATPGFKLIGTIRLETADKSPHSKSLRNIIGLQHWTRVNFSSLEAVDTEMIIDQNFPNLKPILPRISQLYGLIHSLESDWFERGQTGITPQPYHTRELLRWCSRINRLFITVRPQSDTFLISEALNEWCFLEALDIFGTREAFTSEGRRLMALSLAHALDFPQSRVDFCMKQRRPHLSIDGAFVRIGRVTLPCSKKPAHSMIPKVNTLGSFAFTDPSLRTLESIAAAAANSEACLLVGETGVGKTRTIQQLAEMSNNRIYVVNLSQQSDLTDLIGGYKPANVRSLVIPLKEEFEDLFRLTFSTDRNERYIHAIAKAIAKQRYSKVLNLWGEALKLVDRKISLDSSSQDIQERSQLSKKRRLGSKSFSDVRIRWSDFLHKVQTLRRHIEKRAKGFAFTYVPGKLVKAAQAGEWILLDEINLASPDTLESIAELLEAQNRTRSILLTDRGGNQRVVAHSNFRLFAAMNPATDVGKRDLPYAIRSRFTEISVEGPDKDISALATLVKTYLGRRADSDPKVFIDVSKTYLEIKKLQEAHALVDGSGQMPHFSLRNLTRVLQFVQDTFTLFGLRRGLYEGFCMSFLTSLSKVSEDLVENLLRQYIIPAGKLSGASMSRQSRIADNEADYILFKHYRLPVGPLPSRTQSHYVVTPFVDTHLMKIVRATTGYRFPILLQGPTSSGKTSMVEYLASLSGNNYLRLNNHEHTDIQEYIGTYRTDENGTFQFKDGALVTALRRGYWIVLDELNLAPSDVLEALNRLLDDNRELIIPETQEIVRPHPKFMLFATQNPSGTYGGRKPLSRAFRNRFLEIHFDEIPTNELEIILRERSQIAPSFCTKIVTVYKKLVQLRKEDPHFEGQGNLVTLRDLFRWASREVDTRAKLAHQGFMLLAERVRNAYGRKVVQSVIEQEMKVEIDEKSLYGWDSLPKSAGNSMNDSQNIVWTSSARRLHHLVSQALKNNEPVLLIGDTGVGKTKICQALAQLNGSLLTTVNAHQNLETVDLIGSQRPTRHNARLNMELFEELHELLRSLLDYKPASEYTLAALLEKYDGLRRTNALPANVTESAQASLNEKIMRHRLRFEWSDGPLVRCMKGGHYFLLDEISLADDAVLERLNSVLESSRSLYLAEKGSDETPIIASGAFQFLATMNPGGDYGKRELSPALRNRFTEIWVPQITEGIEYEEILSAALQPRWQYLAKPMVRFALWFSENIIAQNYLAVSLRHFLAWADFLNHQPLDQQDIAIFHGITMIYLDALGAHPAAKRTVSRVSVAELRSLCLQRVDQFFDTRTSLEYEKVPTMEVSGTSLSVGGFSIRRSSYSNHWEKMTFCFSAPTAKANTLKIARAMTLPRSILLEGSPGVGKTTLVEAIAAVVNMPLVRVNLSEQTDLADLFGSDVPLEDQEPGRFGWQDAPFLRAMKSGHWVLLDEMNLASQAVLEGLNACLDHRGQVYINELNRAYDRHPDFRIFAAQNPQQQGGGRKGLPESFVNRFTVVFIDQLTRDDLLMICENAHKRVPFQTLKLIVDRIVDLDSVTQLTSALFTHGGPWEFNLRDALRWLQLLTSNQVLTSVDDIGGFHDVLFKHRFRTAEDVMRVSEILLEDTTQPVGRISYTFSSDFVQRGLAFLQRRTLTLRGSPQGFMTQGTNGRLWESIMLCVNQKWPCLLVGASSSGKSAMITQLAIEIGSKVTTVNLNADTDAADLVGRYEQVSRSRDLQELMTNLRSVVRSLLIRSFSPHTSWKLELTDLWDHIKTHEPIVLDVVGPLQKCIEVVASEDLKVIFDKMKLLLQTTTYEPRFEWRAGQVIEAMQRGDWLVLDNANLCSPSVLDRLNSLLEPQRLLSINEHRLSDGSPHVIQAHADFRLFMTMDPKYGELSRAMRNRSVELFMLDPPHIASHVGELVRSSQIAPFDLFSRFDWNGLDNASFAELCQVFLDQLPLCCSETGIEWHDQVMRGLTDLEEPKLDLFSSEFSFFRTFCETEQGLIQYIKKTYGELACDFGLPAVNSAELSDRLPVHPFNSWAFIKMNPQSRVALRLQALGCLLETKKRAFQLTARVRALTQTSRLTLTTFSRPEEDKLQRLARFLHRLSELTGTFMSTSGAYDIPEDDRFKMILEYLELLMSWCSSLYDSLCLCASGKDFIRSVLMIGDDHLEHPALNLVAPSIREAVRSSIMEARQDWQLKRGFSMYRLWNILKAPAPLNASQVQLQGLLDEVVSRFEAVKWMFDLAISDIVSLHCSLKKATLSGTRTGLIGCFAIDDSFLRRIQQTLETIEKQGSSRSETILPFFADVFAILGQWYDATTDLSEAKSDAAPSIIQVLSIHPIRRWMEKESLSLPLQVMERFGAPSCPERVTIECATMKAALPIEMMRKLVHSSNVPLKALRLLQQEIPVLCKHTAYITDRLSHDTHNNCLKTLAYLFGIIVDAHGRLLDESSFRSCKEQLEQIVQGVATSGMSPPAPSLTMKAGSYEAQLLQPVIDRFLQPALEHTCKAAVVCVQDSQNQSIKSIAAATILFFAGCLLLYVPDQAFDPAMRSIAEHEGHFKEIQAATRRVEALITFERIATGQSSSFRIAYEQSRLESLHNNSLPLPAWRPDDSTLSLARPEFEGIERNILARIPTAQGISRFIENEGVQPENIDSLRQNISATMSRFGSNPDLRPYSDVLQPLTAMLRGLDMGLAMASMKNSENDGDNSNIRAICQYTPLMGLRPNIVAKCQYPQIYESISTGHQIAFLQFMALKASVETGVCDQDIQHITEAFHDLYRAWKTQLKLDQDLHARSSAKYRYREGQTIQRSSEEQEIEEMFPVDQNDPERMSLEPRDQFDHHTLSQQATQLHHSIFHYSQNPEVTISTMLHQASNKVAKLGHEYPGLSISPQLTHDLLPAMIARLSDEHENLCRKGVGNSSKSFYHVPNISEVERLIHILTSLWTRFIYLEEIWPDHETIQEVLQLITEVLRFSCATPLAGLIAKVERIHAAIYQWQSTASREYSVSEYCDDVTALLINWRRLELSSWNRLLDREDEMCAQSVASWWFVAYEAMIVTPMTIIDNDRDIQDYAQGLCSTLEDFMSTCAKGQFEGRLGLLEDLCVQLESIKHEHPHLAIVTSTAANFVRYYSRYTTPIHDHLQERRGHLEQDLKEIILLASWKDTNINALQESAKRSHYKLFKVVKKYRILLAGSAQDILVQDIPRSFSKDSKGSRSTEIVSAVSQDDSALRYCSLNFPEWHQRPTRYTEPGKTAKKMQKEGSVAEEAIDSALSLSVFSDSLTNDIALLKKGTPTSFTKEDEKLVKHLKVRKRKLLSETLKSLRRMGFASNLSDRILASQDTTSKVLSRTPTDVRGKGTGDSSVTEFHFHRILSLLPKIRIQGRKYSEDLSSGEVSRIIGYLESVLHEILQEKEAIVSATLNMSRLSTMIQEIQNLWAPGLYQIRKVENQHIKSEHYLKRLVAWLQPIIRTVQKIVRNHGEMAGMDHDLVLERMEQWSNRLYSLGQEFASYPQLPVGVRSIHHSETYVSTKMFLLELNQEVDTLTQRHPHLEFVLRQISAWTAVDMFPTESPAANGHLVLTTQEMERQLCIALDSILVAVQGVKKNTSTLPSSEEEQNWLRRTIISLTSGLKALQVPEVCAALDTLLSGFCHLDNGSHGSLQLAGAMLVTSLPIIRQYQYILSASLSRLRASHDELCRLGDVLSENALRLLSQGFCSPKEASKGDAGQAEKLEGGTGLGEGEGAQDISKDIEDDEDLSELAQNGAQDKDTADIEDQEDAVNMDQEVMEGEMGDANEREDDSMSMDENDADLDDLDEEVGDVDKFDPTAIDEKLWDEEHKESPGGTEKEDSKMATSSREDDQHGERQKESQAHKDQLEAEASSDMSEDEVGEDQTITREDPNQLNPRLEKESKLELPPEVDFNHDDKSSVTTGMTGLDDLESIHDGDRDDGNDEEGEVKSQDEARTEEHEKYTQDSAENEATDLKETASEANEAASVVDTDPDNDEDLDMQDAHEQTRDAQIDHEMVGPNEVQGIGGDPDEEYNDNTALPESNLAKSNGSKGMTARASEAPWDPHEDQPTQPDTKGSAMGKGEPQQPSRMHESFKALGDALEEWHRRRRSIQEALDNPHNFGEKTHLQDVADVDFEHLPAEDAEADTQALDNATDEQARPLTEHALASGAKDVFDEASPIEEDSDGVSKEEDAMDVDEAQQSRLQKDDSILGTQDKNPAPITIREQGQVHSDAMDVDTHPDSPYAPSDDHHSIEASPSSQPIPEDPQAHYLQDIQLTSPFAFHLTEQLRLILNPTHATRYRGGYRTGSRLNMKAVMRFYASNFRDDKIFMRRSVPQKRGYQIMLCIDDSRSMRDSSPSSSAAADLPLTSNDEGGGTTHPHKEEPSASNLALQSLALVTKSLTMLESGEICVVGFGSSVNVLSSFADTWSDTKGAEVWSRFTFQQPKTDVRKLLERSIELFREARRTSRVAAGGEDLWQLQLIVSDGVCEEHEAIRRLVRQAMEERIMIIFVIVDAVNKSNQRSSILEMSQAVFEPSQGQRDDDDDDGGGGGAEPELTIKRYLDGFPFAYYPVVGDVRELPNVLSSALRQWFAEVAEN